MFSIKRHFLLSDCSFNVFCHHVVLCRIADILKEHVAVMFRVHIISTLKMEAAGFFNPSGYMMLQTMRPQTKSLLP